MTTPEAAGIARQLSDVKTLLALFGLALYGVLRVAYGRFYAAFGLSPDDLGLGYLELLAQSALGVVFLLAVFALLIWCYVAFYVWVARDVRDDVRPVVQFARRLLAGDLPEKARVALAGVAAVLLAVLYWRLGSIVLAVAAIGGVAAYWSVSIVRGSRTILRGIGREPPADEEPAARRWRRGLAAIAVVALLLAGATLIGQADMDADSVAAGRATHPEFLGVRLTSWGADPATLAWTTDKVDAALRPLSTSCVMYLGQSDGTIFVALGGATFRVPASQATVRIVPGGHCVAGARLPTR